MRKLLLTAFLFFSIFCQGQTDIYSTQDLRDRINTDIIPNGQKAITGKTLNKILNGFLNVMPSYGGGVNINNTFPYKVTWGGNLSNHVSIDGLGFYDFTLNNLRNFKITGNVGINLGNDATGDMYYRDSLGFFHRIPKGASGQVLTMGATVPSWNDPTGGGSADSTTFATKYYTTQNYQPKGTYVTSESDPSVPSHVKSITLLQKANWDSAYKSAYFDTLTRALHLYKNNGDSSTVIIPKSVGDTGRIAQLSNNIVGNNVTILGDNGAQTTFSKADARIASSDITNWNGKLNPSDTNYLHNTLTQKLNSSDTTAKWQPKGSYLVPNDTSYLHNSDAAKLKITDTTGKWLPNGIWNNTIASKITPADTLRWGTTGGGLSQSQVSGIVHDSLTNFSGNDSIHVIGGLYVVDSSNGKNYLATKVVSSADTGSVTPLMKVTWDSKQAQLQSGTNLKTINGVSLLGPGDMQIVTGKDSSLWYNAIDLGVKGDATTTDNANIQNALNYVASKGGGTIYFPKRTYKLDASAGPSTYGEYIIFIPSNVTVRAPGATFTATNSFAFEMRSNANFYGDQNTVFYRGRLILRAGTENIIVDGLHTKFSQYHSVHFSGYKSNSTDTLAFVGRNIIVRNILIDSSARHGLAFHRALGAYTNGVDSLYNGIWENVTVENVIVKDPSYVSPNNYTSHFDYAFGLEDCKWVSNIRFINNQAWRAPGAGWHKENHVGVGAGVTLENCLAYYNGADTTIAAKSNYGYGFMYDDGYTFNGCHGYGNRKGLWGLEGGVHGNNWAFNNCWTDGMDAFTWQPGITDKDYHFNPKTFGGNSGGWIYAGGSLVLPQKSVQADYFAYGLDSTTVTDLDGSTQKKYTPYLYNTQTYYGSANRENSIALPLIKADTASKYHIAVTMKTISGTVGAPSLFVQEYDKNFSLINRNNTHYLLKADMTSVGSNWTTYDFYIGAGAVTEENAVGTFGGNSAEFMRSAQWLRLAVSFSESSSDNKTYALSQFNIEKVVTATVSTDATVTSGSVKPVQSGAVKTYVDNAVAGVSTNVTGMPNVASLSALKAINNATDNAAYYLAGITSANDGGGGVFTWKATSTATPDDALVVQATGVTTGRYHRQINNNEVYLKWYGTKSDWNSTLTALINAGYKIHGEPGVTYNVTNPINITDKSLYFDGHGAKITFTTSNSNYFLNQTISNTTPASVTKISYGNTAKGGIDTIYVSGHLSGVAKGSLVKIYSDDKVATFNTGGDVRKAEFITPLYVLNNGANDTLIIQRYLNYTYSTNVKVALIPYYTTEIKNARFYATSGTAGGFNVVGVTKPLFENITFEHLLYPAMTLRGCYQPLIDKLSVYEVEDAIGGPGPSGSTGYGVNDNGCQGLRLTNSVFSGLRHAYTTSGQVSGTDYNYYGEALFPSISNCVAKNCQHAFDTHEQGYGITFNNCQVFNSVAGFQLRARNVTLNGCVVDSVGTGIQTGATSLDSTSKIFLNDLTLKRTAGSVINSPSAGIENIYISGGYWEGKDMNISRTNLYINGLTSILTGQTGSGIDQWITADSETNIEANNVNITSTAPSNFALAMVQNGAKVYVNNAIVNIQNAGTIHLARAQSSSTINSIVHAKNILFKGGNNPTVSTSTLSSGLPAGVPFYMSQIGKLTDLQVSWRTEKMDGSSSTSSSANMPLIFSGTTITWYNNYFDEPTIVGTFYNVPAGADLSGLTIPAGTRVGQQMILYNSHASNPVVLPALNNGSNYTLPAKGSKIITWTGSIWVY